jgi:hypothetical protein
VQGTGSRRRPSRELPAPQSEPLPDVEEPRVELDAKSSSACDGSNPPSTTSRDWRNRHEVLPHVLELNGGASGRGRPPSRGRFASPSRPEREIASATKVISTRLSIPPRLARLALEAALTRLAPGTPPPLPSGCRATTPADHSQHGPAPATCWFCDKATWWKTDDRSARWLCARCVAPDANLFAIWYEPSAAELEDAAREPRWSAAPERDDYLLLRSRKVARDAARAGADLLGAWRPAVARTAADLRVLDWHSVTRRRRDRRRRRGDPPLGARARRRCPSHRSPRAL